MPTKEAGGFINSAKEFYLFMLDQAKNNPVEVAALGVKDPKTGGLVYLCFLGRKIPKEAQF